MEVLIRNFDGGIGEEIYYELVEKRMIGGTVSKRLETSIKNVKIF